MQKVQAMKLTDDDFTSHPCDDASKGSDGLGWNLDADLTTEGKNELIQNQKLRELVEKYSKLDAFGSFCEQLLQESKK